MGDKDRKQLEKGEPKYGQRMKTVVGDSELLSIDEVERIVSQCAAEEGWQRLGEEMMSARRTMSASDLVSRAIRIRARKWVRNSDVQPERARDGAGARWGYRVDLIEKERGEEGVRQARHRGIVHNRETLSFWMFWVAYLMELVEYWKLTLMGHGGAAEYRWEFLVDGASMKLEARERIRTFLFGISTRR